MKLLLKILLIIWLLFSFNLITNWATWDIKVRVTEKVPWANCNTWATTSTWIYECTITPWFSSISIMMWKIIKWITAIAALAWVLFIVVNWIMLSMWWMDPWVKDEAKKRITQTIFWLILLLLSWVILSMIAPWVYK